MKKIAVIGAGSWATAIVKILLCNAPHVYWWVREEEVKNGLQAKGRNPLYLSDVKFDRKKITVSNDIKTIVDNADLLILAVPAVFLQDSLESLTPKDLKGKKVCSAIKGIIPQTNQVVGDFLYAQYKMTADNFAVISGPSHAEEIAWEKLTYLTVASENVVLAKAVAKIFACDYVKTQVSQDVLGIEYAAVLKNIYAIALGIAKGLGYGDNFRAALIANAMQEMNGFISKIYKTERSLASAVYLGDLLVTSYSQYSRNRTFGAMIGEGYSVKSAQIEMQMVAEGYYACECIHEINKKKRLNIPIVETVYAILYNKKPAKQEFEKLSEKIK